ncbi:MAG: TRAP-type C4-dicarboxylate transport system permease small subunit [Gammaproteobacteria bacterium]|jgi:TRAP-type C4-dicarboxylate transport system permease small subunit
MLNSALTWLHRLEDTILALLLTSMIGMASGQVILRNFFDYGVAWFDPAVRVAVLWLALLGALAATRRNEHVSVDVLSRFLPDAITKVTDRLARLFACLICGLVAYYSGLFVWQESGFPSEVFLGIPSWVTQLIIPWAFSFMSLRFMLLTLGASTPIEPTEAASEDLS